MKQFTLLFLLSLSIGSLTQTSLQCRNSYEWESSLQAIRITPSPHSYARFPAPTDPDEKNSC
ncbi:hypothetical protein [Fluviicola sp.]|uniref:hypothetical protein n=1 Tax=Fluviicola sp. TaxID=1917219 RepID=UPI0031D240BC